MDLPDHVHAYLKHIVRCIKETMPVTAIYLFGSYATGNYHADSDLDIYIISTDKTKKIIELRRDASRAVGVPKIMAVDFLVGYQEDFERRSRMINTIESEVREKGVNIYAIA